jgi:hypothetical protein
MWGLAIVPVLLVLPACMQLVSSGLAPQTPPNNVCARQCAQNRLAILTIKMPPDKPYMLFSINASPAPHRSESLGGGSTAPVCLLVAAAGWHAP